MAVSGLDGRPYQSLDHLIDTQALRALHHDIIVGIARSPRWYGSYGENIRDPEKYLDPALAERRLLHLPDGEAIRRRYARLKKMDDKRLFLKLVLGAYSGHRRITLCLPEKLARDDGASGRGWIDITRSFPDLLKWIEAQKLFAELEYVSIFLTEHDNVLVEHCDDNPRQSQQRRDMIWLRTDLDRSLYVLDRETNQRHYVDGYSTVFDQTDYYGGDPNPRMTFYIRIDGNFTQATRESISASIEKAEE